MARRRPGSDAEGEMAITLQEPQYRRDGRGKQRLQASAGFSPWTPERMRSGK